MLINGLALGVCADVQHLPFIKDNATIVSFCCFLWLHVLIPYVYSPVSYCCYQHGSRPLYLIIVVSTFGSVRFGSTELLYAVSICNLFYLLSHAYRLIDATATSTTATDYAYAYKTIAYDYYCYHYILPSFISPSI